MPSKFTAWFGRPARTPAARPRLGAESLEGRAVPAAFDPAFGTGGTVQVGGAAGEGAFNTARDAAGNTYLVGAVSGAASDFDPGAGTVALGSRGGLDGFVAKYAPDGSLLWARGLGGAGYDKAAAVAVDAAGNVAVGGQVTGPVDLDPAATYADNRDLLRDGGYVARFAPDGSLGSVWQSSGGAAWSEVKDLAADSNGNVVAAGSFPNSSSSYVTCSVAKIGAAGGQLWRSDISGSKGSFSGNGVALDGAGNVYLAGGVTGTVDADPGAGTLSLSGGGGGAVVEKLSPTGALVWAKLLKGTGLAVGHDVAVDGAGGVYSVGYSEGKVDFDPGKAAYTLQAPAAGGTFVSKLDAAGNFAWARGVGADDAWNSATRLALDGAGGVVVAGSFKGSGDFDPGTQAHTLTSAGATDGFVLKLDAAGAFAWALQMGGAGGDYATGLAVDAGGAVYVSGYFNGSADFGGTTLTSAGSSDLFLSKIDPT